MSDGHKNPRLKISALNMGVFRVRGADAETFLQDLITNDMKRLNNEEALYAALLTPQGKTLFAFFLLKARGEAHGDFHLLTPLSLKDSLLAKLQLYRLRADVALEDETENYQIWALWGEGESPPPLPIWAEDDGASHIFSDPRLPSLGYHILRDRDRPPPSADALIKIKDEEAWREHCRAQGVPDWTDIKWGGDFPTEINMDMLNGMDYEKGCFVGQEVASRMKRRGRIRSRILMAEAEGVPQGAEIRAGELPVGFVRHAGRKGLAVARLDRLKAAEEKGLSLSAAGEPIRLRAPQWMS